MNEARWPLTVTNRPLLIEHRFILKDDEGNYKQKPSGNQQAQFGISKCPWKMVFLYQPVIFRVHVSLPGCRL